MITQRYDLDIIPTFTPPIVRVSQFDDGGRTIGFKLYKGTGSYAQTSAQVFVKGIEVPCTVLGVYVYFVVTADVTNEPGIFLGEVRDTTARGICASCNFIFVVDNTPMR